MKEVQVVIDNLKGSVVGIFPEEKDAKEMLKVLGDEKIDEEFARFAYEAWTWEEVIAWGQHPGNMGLGETTILSPNELTTQTKETC